MTVLNFFDQENKEHWLGKIKESDWGAGEYLHYLLSKNKLAELVGERTRVLLLTEGEELAAFCTLAEKDDIQPTDLTPWIGFIYTFPHYRGRRLAGELLTAAEKLAKADGFDRVHISTNHIGLYEKYGYEFFAMMKDIEGEDSRVYIKEI